MCGRSEPEALVRLEAFLFLGAGNLPTISGGWGEVVAGSPSRSNFAASLSNCANQNISSYSDSLAFSETMTILIRNCASVSDG